MSEHAEMDHESSIIGIYSTTHPSGENKKHRAWDVHALRIKCDVLSQDRSSDDPMDASWWTTPAEIESSAINETVLKWFTNAIIPKAQTSPAVVILNSFTSKYSGAIQFKVPVGRCWMARLNDTEAKWEEPKSLRSTYPSLETKTLLYYKGLSNQTHLA